MINAIFPLIFFLSSYIAFSQPSSHTTAELIAEKMSITPGETFTAAIKFDMAPGWHIYWLNPGDSGMPISVKFMLPNGFKASGLSFPFPHNFITGGIANFGYENETLLLTKITVPKDYPKSTATLRAKVKWLECKEACLPGNAFPSSEIKVGKNISGIKTKYYDLIQKSLIVRTEIK